MSDKPSREEFEQYKELRNSGDYRAAAKVLLPYKDNPKVRKLIDQLREAHLPSVKPSSKSVGRGKSKTSWGKRLFIVFGVIIGICGAIYLAYLAWYQITDQQGQGDRFGMELDLWS